MNVVKRSLLSVSTFAEAPGFLGFGAHRSDLVQFVARGEGHHRSHHELLHKPLHLTESATSLVSTFISSLRPSFVSLHLVELPGDRRALEEFSATFRLRVESPLCHFDLESLRCITCRIEKKLTYRVSDFLSSFTSCSSTTLFRYLVTGFTALFYFCRRRSHVTLNSFPLWLGQFGT
jgi:hypothetical protein